MNKKILLLILMITFSVSVIAWTPPSDADFRDYYNLYNVSSMTGENATFDYFFGDGSGLTNTGNSSFNQTLTDSLYISQSEESNLNVNSSDYSNSSAYWDNLNSPSDINTGDITDDGTYILSVNEADLNVNSSNSSSYWDNLNNPSDITGLIDSQITNLSWDKLTSYPYTCHTNTYITQLDDNVTCQAISQIDNNVVIDGDLNVSKLNIEDGQLLTSLKSTAINGFNYIEFSSQTAADGRETWNVGENIGSFDNSLEFSNDSFSTIMIMKQEGDVGIGTISPSQKLEVNGNLNVTGLYYGNGSQLTGITTGGAFLTTTGITSNSPGNLSGDDFVFGSTSLDDDGNISHDARMFFDKSKGAFRAGIMSTDGWDEANLGGNSVGFGYELSVSGNNAAGFGIGTNASGSYSLISGQNGKASGLWATSHNFAVDANGFGSNGFGREYKNDNKWSVSVGYGSGITDTTGVGIRLEADSDQDDSKKPAIYFKQTTAPNITTDKLYNIGGALTWNGVDLTAGGGDLWSDLVDSDIIPDTNWLYDLGNSSHNFNYMYSNNYASNFASTRLYLKDNYAILYVEGKKSIYYNPTIDTLFLNQGLDNMDVVIAGDTDANLIYSDAGLDFVGIGTATPSEKLDVNGNISATYFKGDGSLLTGLSGSANPNPIGLKDGIFGIQSDMTDDNLINSGVTFSTSVQGFTQQLDSSAGNWFVRSPMNTVGTTSVKYSDNKSVVMEARISSTIHTGVTNIGFGTSINIDETALDPRAYFIINGNNIYAVNGNLTDVTATNITSGYTFDAYNILRIEHNALSDIKYYVNGNLVATHTTSLPDTSAYSYQFRFGGDTSGERFFVSPLYLSMEI